MIKYIHDKESIYMSDILKHLRSYNTSFTGDKTQLTNYFYVTDNNELVGYIETSLSWDWVSLGDMFYENIEVLRHLLYTVCEKYRNISVGINIRSTEKTRVEEFISLGFELSGIVEGTLKTENYYYADLLSFDIHSDLNLDVIMREEMIEKFDEILREKNKIYNKKDNLSRESEDYMIVALDNDVFVGGVQGVITEDSMNIHLLVVNEEYRNRDIGTKLMTLIEDVAVRKDIAKIYLGTVEFQARSFYEKLGYKVVMTRKNVPKGYDSYKLVKLI
ncbi:GNAT family N-acetyltransferase [Mycoplasmatota bacterium WC44]